MRYTEFLPEALSTSNELVAAATEALPRVIDEFIKYNLEDIMLASKVLNSYDMMIQYADRRNAAYAKDDWKTADQLGDKLSDFHSEVSAGLDNPPYNDDITQELVHLMELELQDIAKEYTERHYGKIEPITEPGTDRQKLPYDSMNKLFDTRHLYWAEHILTQININAGKAGGGFYTATPTRNQATSRLAKNIRWGNEFAVLINVYADKNKIWSMITDSAKGHMSEKVYGEGADPYAVTRVIKPIISTFLHEMVHFEQDIRARSKTKNKTYTNKSVLPNADVQRPKLTNLNNRPGQGAPDQQTSYPKYRGGRRGHYPNNIDNSNDPKVWAEYLGHNIEIEAHAATAAAKLYTDEVYAMRSRYRGSKVAQVHVNDMIDNMIENIKWGEFPENFYQQEIANRAKTALHLSNPSNEDKRFIKVWNLFRKKLIQHLKSYQKELPPDTSVDDWIKSLS